MCPKDAERARVMPGIGRREILVFAGAAGWVAAWQLWPRDQRLNFEQIPSVPGWRIADGGAASNAVDVATMGISEGPGPMPIARLDAAVHRDATGPKLRAAVFTDFYCPNCRVMDARLRARPDLALSWHELPLLGRPSQVVARGLAAAGLQAARDRFHDKLLSDGFHPTPGGMVDVARRARLNSDKLRSDMAGDAVALRLADSAATADRLGIAATPALVLERDVVLGALDRDTLDALIAERRG